MNSFYSESKSKIKKKFFWSGGAGGGGVAGEGRAGVSDFFL